VDLLQTKGFWVLFISGVIVSLFLYGTHIDSEMSTLEKITNDLELARDSIEVLDGNLQMSQEKNGALITKNSSLNDSLIIFKSRINELELSIQNHVNDVQYIDRVIYRDNRSNYLYGKGMGKLSVYITCSSCQDFKVWVDGNFVGEIGSYFSGGSPNCGQNGTLNVLLRKGLHHIECRDKKKTTWKKDVVIEENECYVQGFK
jgi:hypothetical protein